MAINLGGEASESSKYPVIKGREIGHVISGLVVGLYKRPRQASKGTYLLNDQGGARYEAVLYLQADADCTANTGSEEHQAPVEAGQVVRWILKGKEYSALVEFMKNNPFSAGTHVSYEVTSAQPYDQNGKPKGKPLTDQSAVPARGTVGFYGDPEFTVHDEASEGTPEYKALEVIAKELQPVTADLEAKSKAAFDTKAATSATSAAPAVATEESGEAY